jgi:hypothetical protein
MASGPYGLLLSNVDVGYGSRFWGPQVLTTTDVASFMTAWNVKSQVKVRVALDLAEDDCRFLCCF